MQHDCVPKLVYVKKKKIVDLNQSRLNSIINYMISKLPIIHITPIQTWRELTAKLNYTIIFKVDRHRRKSIKISRANIVNINVSGEGLRSHSTRRAGGLTVFFWGGLNPRNPPNSLLILTGMRLLIRIENAEILIYKHYSF